MVLSRMVCLLKLQKYVITICCVSILSFVFVTTANVRDEKNCATFSFNNSTNVIENFTVTENTPFNLTFNLENINCSELGISVIEVSSADNNSGDYDPQCHILQKDGQCIWPAPNSDMCNCTDKKWHYVFRKTFVQSDRTVWRFSTTDGKANMSLTFNITDENQSWNTDPGTHSFDPDSGETTTAYTATTSTSTMSPMILIVSSTSGIAGGVVLILLVLCCRMCITKLSRRGGAIFSFEFPTIVDLGGDSLQFFSFSLINMTCARLRDAVLVITHWNSSDGNLTNECNDEAKDGVCDASNSNTLKCTCNSSDDAYHFNKTLEQFIFAIPLYESSAGGNITGTYKFTLKHADIWHINYLHIALGAGAIVTFVVIVGGALGRQKMIARRKRKMQALRSCGRSFFIVGAPSTTPRARRKGDNAVTKVPRASPSADSPSGTWSEERDVHTLGSYGVPNTLFHEQSRYDGSHLYTHQTSNKLSRIQTPNIIHSRGRPVGTYFPQADHRAPSRLGSYLAHYFTRLSTVIHLLFNIYGVVENLPRERAGLFNPETQAVACTAPYAHLQEAEFEDHNPHYERIPEGSEHGSVRDEMSLFRLDERRQQRTIFSESKSVHSYYSVY